MRRVDRHALSLKQPVRPGLKAELKLSNGARDSADIPQ
jgi:hypothetical protein